MATTYTHIFDLAKEAEPPADGILSRTLFQDERVKVVLFGFSAAQELSAIWPLGKFWVFGRCDSRAIPTAACLAPWKQRSLRSSWSC